MTMGSLTDLGSGGAAGSASTKDDLASGWIRAVVGLYLSAVAVALMYFLVALWPEEVTQGVWNKELRLFFLAPPLPRVSDDVRLLSLVIVAGGLGSFIHAATSFVDYVGNRKFVGSWMLWYLIRPLIGSALALVLYAAVRGGLLTATAGSQSVSPYGVSALAFLAGMFSKQATDKLSELFSTLFKTGDAGDAARNDKLDSAPKVASIEPPQLQVGGSLDLIVNGSGFENASIVRLNGEPKPTTFISASKVSVKLAATDIQAPGTLSLTVNNASGQSSPAVTVTVVP